MSSSRKVGRQALADFFSALVPQRAHWYSIILPIGEGGSEDRIAAAFPPLSKIASLHEEMLREILLQCGLLQFRQKSGHSVLEQEWLNFKCEFDLADFEVTHFTIKKKKRYYVRLGSWSALLHIRRSPAEIWSSSSSGKLRVPRVSTSSIRMTLAQAIGSLDLTLPTHYSRVSADSKSISDSESNDKQCSDNEEESSKNEKEASMYDTHLLIDLPDADKFPLLNSLFLTNAGHCNLFDRLVN